MSENELKSKLKEYKELKEMFSELEDALKTIEDEVKNFMGDTEELNVDGIKVRWTKFTSNRFDTTTFKKEHSSMYEQYVKASESRRFQIA